MYDGEACLCRTVLEMLSRDPANRPNLDELLDEWGPLAQTMCDGTNDPGFLASSSSA